MEIKNVRISISFLLLFNGPEEIQLCNDMKLKIKQ